MLDVHPPHHPVHAWRDFFIHIATIVVGLLIAVGLEQTVEHFHHRHQLKELREGIVADARQSLHDVDEDALAITRQVEDLDVRIQQVQQAIAQHRKVGPPAYRPGLPMDSIKTGNIDAAKSSGLFQLLSQEEIATLTEPEVGIAHADALMQRIHEVTRKRLAFEQKFQASYPAGDFDFSAATSAQLDEYLGLLIDERVIGVELQDYLHVMHRGGTAFLEGQRNIDKLREAEDISTRSSPH
jgi:hypothetical protein